MLPKIDKELAKFYKDANLPPVIGLIESSEWSFRSNTPIKVKVADNWAEYVGEVNS